MERRVIATVLLMLGLTALALYLNQPSALEEIVALLFDVGKTGLP